MAENTFKKGDVVRLNSGGPAMTVTGIGKTASSGVESVWVSWFDESGKPHNGVYPVETVDLDE